MHKTYTTLKYYYIDHRYLVFQVEILTNVLIGSFCFIWKPIWLCHCVNLPLRGSTSDQILTSKVDPRAEMVNDNNSVWIHKDDMRGRIERVEVITYIPNIYTVLIDIDIQAIYYTPYSAIYSRYVIPVRIICCQQDPFARAGGGGAAVPPGRGGVVLGPHDQGFAHGNWACSGRL